MLEFDAIVIGGGIIGLATTAALSKKYDRVLLLEKNNSILMETSSRNSEVVHAGLYYSDMPMKNDLCLNGRHLLEDFCSTRNVNFSKVGKYVFSNNTSDNLDVLFNKALSNGAEDISMCVKSQITFLNQWCYAKHAFFSPNTGIVDSHGLGLSLLIDIEDHNGICCFSSCVTDIEHRSNYSVKFTDGNGHEVEVESQVLINCGGLSSIDVLNLLYRDHGMENFLVKGHYFGAVAPPGISHLLYPMPESLGLGVHLTIDLDGRIRFGPDTHHVSEVNYKQEVSSSEFYEQIALNFKIDIRHGLKFDYAGIRPKIKRNGAVVNDYVFLTEKEHSLNGFVSLHGIDSPGLTSCLAIAEKIVEIV